MQRRDLRDFFYQICFGEFARVLISQRAIGVCEHRLILTSGTA
jgi:hypothetical protein